MYSEHVSTTIARVVIFSLLTVLMVDVYTVLFAISKILNDLTLSFVYISCKSGGDRVCLKS